MLSRLAYSEAFLKLSNLLQGQSGRLRHDFAWRPQLKKVNRYLQITFLATFLTPFRETFFKTGLLGVFNLIVGVTCCCHGLYVILFVNVVKAGVLGDVEEAAEDPVPQRCRSFQEFRQVLQDVEPLVEIGGQLIHALAELLDLDEDELQLVRHRLAGRRPRT